MLVEPESTNNINEYNNNINIHNYNYNYYNIIINEYNNNINYENNNNNIIINEIINNSHSSERRSSSRRSNRRVNYGNNLSPTTQPQTPRCRGNNVKCPFCRRECKCNEWKQTDEVETCDICFNSEPLCESSQCHHKMCVECLHRIKR